MINIKKMKIIIVLSILMAFSIGQVGFAAELPIFEMPVLVTSAGQCPQFDIIRIFAGMAALRFDSNSMPTVEMISAGVGLKQDPPGDRINTDLDIYPLGTPYRTVFVSMGASLKGMGAAGISSDQEYRRIEQVMSWLRNQEDLKIIAVHVAGESRRYHHLSEGIIDRVAPYADLLLVSHESNEDGRFSDLSAEYDIPMAIINNEFEIIDLVEEIFEL